jgi:hypothetical protein
MIFFVLQNNIMGPQADNQGFRDGFREPDYRLALDKDSAVERAGKLRGAS